MAKPRHLSQRIFPDIDLTFHCVAVKINDQIDLLCKQRDLPKSDVDKLKELLNMLVIIKKNIKHKKKTPKEQAISNTYDEDILG